MVLLHSTRWHICPTKRNPCLEYHRKKSTLFRFCFCALKNPSPLFMYLVHLRLASKVVSSWVVFGVHMLCFLTQWFHPRCACYRKNLLKSHDRLSHVVKCKTLTEPSYSNENFSFKWEMPYLSHAISQPSLDIEESYFNKIVLCFCENDLSC